MKQACLILATVFFAGRSIAIAQSTMTIHTISGATTFDLSNIDSITFSTGSAPPESTALVAYYPFNGNANDSTVTGNNGIIHGGTWVDDRFGNSGSALSLNGQSDFVEIPDNAVLKPPAVSVTMWVKVTAFTSLKTGGNPTSQYILVKKNSLSTNWNGYDFEFDDVHGLFDAVVASSGGIQIFSYSLPGSVQAGQWYYLALTADPSLLRLYVNGFLVAEKHTGFPLDYSITASPLTIGSTMDPWNGYFNGAVDDVRIYKGVLTADQILGTYNRSKSVIRVEGTDRETGSSK